MSKRNVYARLVRLDERMTGIFRGLWCRVAMESEQRSEPSWRALIANLSDEEIATGLAHCAGTWTGKHPPALPEFRDLCRPPDQRNAEQRAFDARVELEAPEPMGRLPSPEDIRAQREREPEEFDRKVIEGCNRILGNMRIAENYADWRASLAEGARRKP